MSASLARPTLAVLAALGVGLTTVTALPASAAEGATETAAITETSGTDVRPLPDRIFADDSFWYRELPQDTPVDPNSDAIMADLITTAEEHWGSPGNPNVAINTSSYSPTIYTANLSDPMYTFTFDNCQNKPESWGDSGLVEKHLTDINVPADAVPADGTDAEMVIYNEDTDTLTEIWKAQRTADGGWSACWGGSIENVSESDGIFENPFGVTAAGLPLLGGTLRIDELMAGEVDHVVGIALPYASQEVSSPATRTDGRDPGGMDLLAQGQMIRIPADVDIDALGLPPVARAIAEAGQEYGFMVWDTAGAVSLRAENPKAYATTPYPEMLRGGAVWNEMADFPLHLFEVLPMDYEAPVDARASSDTEPVVEPASEPAAEPTAEETTEPASEPAAEPTTEPTSEETRGPKGSPWGENGRRPGRGNGNTTAQAQPQGPTVHFAGDQAGTSAAAVTPPSALPGDEIIAGDWDGDGVDTLGLRRGNEIKVWNTTDATGEPAHALWYGRPGEPLLVGDWDGDGRDTVAVRRGAVLHVIDTMDSANASRTVQQGTERDVARAGRFAGQQHDSLLLRANGTNVNRIHLALDDRDPAHENTFGRPGDDVLVGDWDGDGEQTHGVRRGASFLLRDDLAGGGAHHAFTFGRAGDDVLVGDWDGDGVDTAAIVRR